MRTLTQSLVAAVMGTVILASCSRPVAYFQPSARENFKSPQPNAVAVVTPATEVKSTETEMVEAVSTTSEPTAADQLAQTKQAVSQVEAYVRNDTKLASSKKLTKRMAKLNELLNTASDKAVTSTNVASAKKMTFMERTMLKKMDKKIKNHVAPDQTKVMNSNVRLGLIIGIVGLLLLLLGGGSVLGILGLIGFIVGLVLILIGVINA
ncbi:hypothetical protein [Spirosoma foliorum]|uniref:Uncharacterized protein n=1 Tax=Spirosoma foliorum TaxID=2710596 RepID=A0A7G5GMS3_9BACT|nr:hypothetical protein [Spirosoma foliorum]QMW00165.1 hypothetical protein H3H32_19240 [Spirosoma foliorum]